MRSAIALLAMLAAAPVDGQQTAEPSTPTHVPIEFLELLGASTMGGRAEIMVGRLPESLFDLLRPGTDARIVGSMVYPMGFSTSALVVPGRAEAVRERWLARVREAGWTPPPRRVAPQRSGFDATDTESTRNDALCAPDGSAMINVGAAPHTGDSSAVVIVHASGMMSSNCIDRGDRMPPRPTAPMPTLPSPEGAFMAGSGSGGGGSDGANSYARVRSQLTLPQLAEHYAAEMERQGWSAGAPSHGTDVVAQLFHRSDDEGERWQALLTVTPLPGGLKYLHMRVVRERR